MRSARLDVAALAALVAFAGAACATRSDVDALRADLNEVRTSQDSLARALAEVNRSFSTELEAQRTFLLEMRGNMGRQLEDMERQLVQIQELLGQSQATLRGLRERIDSRDEDTMAGWPGVDTLDADTVDRGGVEARPPGDDAGRALYSAAMEQFRRGQYNTARSGFEEFLAEYPNHELTPDVQLNLAETYRETGDLEQALREYSRVVDLYPNADAAPTALHKAGVVQLERGNKDSACEYFQRVLADYPRSDVARLARDQSQRLNCR